MQRAGTVVVDGRVLALERERAIVIGQRLRRSLEHRVQIGAIGKRRYAVRIECDGAIVARLGFGVALQHLERRAVVVPGLDGKGVDLDGAAKPEFRVCGCALLQMHDSKQMRGVEIPGLPRKDGFADSAGAVVTAGAEIRHGIVERVPLSAHPSTAFPKRRNAQHPLSIDAGDALGVAQSSLRRDADTYA